MHSVDQPLVEIFHLIGADRDADFEHLSEGNIQVTISEDTCSKDAREMRQGTGKFQLEAGINIKLTVAYDGGNYLGWQKTTMGPSIEETLQQVLEKILQEQIILQAASRTDAGVHAKGQIVNFLTQKNPSLKRLKISLNCLLPKDIAVMDVEMADIDFHPTLDCRSKEYHYSVCYGTAQLPQHRFYSWHYPHALDISAMRAAALLLTGEHDYAAFCNFKKNHAYAHYVRQVELIDIIELPEELLCIRVRGNNFLYKMVRNLVGH